MNDVRVRKLIDVGFLGAAQTDRWGSINTTVIGGYRSPKVRLPGAGGAPEIAAASRQVMALLLHSKRAFVEEIDFTTSTSSTQSRTGEPRVPMVVITDLGILRQDPASGELVLSALHDGVELDQVVDATGWELRVADRLETTPPPTAEELSTLRGLRAGEPAGRPV